MELQAEKLKISRSIVAAIREQNGRFLERASGKDVENEGREGAWYDIGDKKAVEKTSQALREGQPKLRRKMAELEAVGGTSSVVAARALAAASGEAAATGNPATTGPAISLVTQAMAPGAITSEEGRSRSVGSHGGSVGGSVLSTASTVQHRNMRGGGGPLNGSLGSAIQEACNAYGGGGIGVGGMGTAAAAHAASLTSSLTSHQGQRHLAFDESTSSLGGGRPATIGRTPSGTPYVQMGGEDAGDGTGDPLTLSEDSLRKLKMEHGITLSEDSYRAMGMQQQQGGMGMGPGMQGAVNTNFDPDPIPPQQEAELMGRRTLTEQELMPPPGAPQSVVETPQNVRQTTATTSNLSGRGGGGAGYGRKDLRSSLERMGKLPSIRSKLGANMDLGFESNRSNVGAAGAGGGGTSNISLMSDFSGVGTSAASGISRLGGGYSGRGVGSVDDISLRDVDSMDISGRGLDARDAGVDQLVAGAAAGQPGGEVSVWDASESTRELTSIMKQGRGLVRAARGDRIMAYMTDARSTSSPGSVASGASVDSRRAVFAKMKKKPRGPLPRTIVTGRGNGGGGEVGTSTYSHAAAVGGANLSGASGLTGVSGTTIGYSKTSVDSGLLSCTSGLLSKQSFNTRGTGSISTLSWKSGANAEAAGGATTSARMAGGNTETIMEASTRSVDSFGMAVDDMLGTGLESGRSVTSTFSRMSLMSDFDQSLDFSSKDFSSRDASASTASKASRNLVGTDSSRGASSSSRSAGSRGRRDGRGQTLEPIHGGLEEDDFDKVDD